MTNSPQQRMQQGLNPFVESGLDPVDGMPYPILELKFGLVFYLADPPGPRRA